MSLIDNVIIECKNSGAESRHAGGYPFRVDCPACGKRLIVEWRNRPDPKNRRYQEETIYTNGCILKGSTL